MARIICLSKSNLRSFNITQEIFKKNMSCILQCLIGDNRKKHYSPDFAFEAGSSVFPAILIYNTSLPTFVTLT